MKKAFTLVELIVVIGIIGILTGVLLASFGGATESARSAKCISNLRSLAAAANSRAMSSGRYPCAGSVEYIRVQGKKLTYREMPGWISWLSCDGQYGRTISGSVDDDESTSEVNYPTKHQKCDNCPWFGTGELKRDEYALANGSIWLSCGRNRSLYVCPAHDRNFNGTPVFSYVMNAKFGYDITRGEKALGIGEPAVGIEYGRLARADRTLMFADIHTTAEDGKNTSKGYGPEYDAVLNYKATVDGKEYGSDWQGTPEQIGFPHKGAKGRSVGHVVFADGHTAKLIEPTGEGSINLFQLTALLCEGKDYSFTGSSYQFVRDE